ncbi:MAG: hypothetical protein ABI954_01420, partial [Pyrinomonadaceae bacterium]
EVKKAVQLLMNARARREAISLMDKGDYAGAQSSLKAVQMSTQVLAAAMPAAAAPQMDAESAQLRELESALFSRADDKASRKKMAYQSYSRRSGKS